MTTATGRRAFTVRPRGAFSLRELATLGFGHRTDTGWDGCMRLAFCTDGYRGYAGVEVRQDPDGLVRGVIHGDADAEVVRAQVTRVLSLDYDGTGFAEVGRRDPVIARLQDAAPGLRPPLFYSPYEAAAWAVISARRSAAQMARVRDRLAEAHGAVFDLAGQRLAAFPAPERLLAVEEFPGLPEPKISRLHGVAHAALDGRLDAARLRAMPAGEAMADVRSLDGIGPFYSALIVVRGTGFADVLPTDEPHLLDLVRRLYDLPATPGAAEFEELAKPWAPFRTWCAVLVRAAGGRLLAG